MSVGEEGGAVTFGVAVFRNKGTTNIVIRDVRPESVENAEVEGYMMVPSTGTETADSRVGILKGYPPDDKDSFQLTLDWSSSGEVEDYVLEPGDAAQLIMGMYASDPSEIARIRGLVVEYKIDDEQYRASTVRQFVITPENSPP